MIDLDRLNGRLPYRATREQTSAGEFFRFTTEHGVEYSVGFLPDDSIVSKDTFQFIISNINDKPSPNDDKVRETIMIMIDEFFLTSPKEVLLYICETADGKQAMRNRLFHYWFSMYDRNGEFTCLSSSIPDEEGIMNYATLIIRNDNPALTERMNEFLETIQLLNSKP